MESPLGAANMDTRHEICRPVAFCSRKKKLLLGMRQLRLTNVLANWPKEWLPVCEVDLQTQQKGTCRPIFDGENAHLQPQLPNACATCKRRLPSHHLAPAKNRRA